MDLHEQPTQPFGSNNEMDGEPDALTQPIVQSPLPEAVNRSASPAPSANNHFSRRALFAGLAGGVTVALAGGVALAEWEQQSGNPSTDSGTLAPGTQRQIGHLLRKTGFGVTAADLTTYSALGYSGTVDRLLNYNQVSDTVLEQLLSARSLDLTKARNQPQWWLLRMVYTQRPLLEKMTLFWHGVLTSNYQKVGGPTLYQRMIVQNNFLRAHAFDTFDNILLGITSDPAMLFYLDLTRSHKNAPNENYARELMELFTLGLGHYSQQDVEAAAAALTGWHVKGGTYEAQYNPHDHADRELTFLGHTGNLNYKDVIAILANHPATPWFIARKLFTFFAYENPSNEDLQPLVDAYTQNKHSIGAMMRALLLSSQFSSVKAYRSRIKSPTEFVVGSYRALGTKSSGKELPTQTYLLGQTLFSPPNVAGWPGDKVSSLWLNSGTWMSRLNYINLMLTGGRTAGVTYKPLDIQSIVDTQHIATPVAFVAYFASFLLDGNITADRTSQLVDYFTTPDPVSRKGHVTLANGTSYPLSKVRGTLYLMLAAPEYQLN
ncbi:DUF1800 domain-containing protein [Dictyobacter arantiisoli]|uniref:DUF1800 domain-containing protein n=1 Tax=Dictyobacter arantiisoli TaxID=2014874 RepID=A0A5A5T9D3_9CHLR|nr:DUF1800 domain-containing protein [Dictyobacter arantiisoli]GCF07643.1 hypothetical protein KDI_12070 [Dictyobacter arantiisoli]